MKDQGTGKSEMELEIKVALTGEEYQKILTDAQGDATTMRGCILQKSVIIDTPSGELQKADSMLRLREETHPDQSVGFITFKGPSTQVSTAKSRLESEEEFNSSYALSIVLGSSSVDHLFPMPLRHVFKMLGWRLECKTTFKNFRTPIPFPVEGIVTEKPFVIELDKTTFEDGTVDYELEVEVREVDDVPAVEAELQRLFDRLGIQFRRQTKGKATRALAHKRVA